MGLCKLPPAVALPGTEGAYNWLTDQSITRPRTARAGPSRRRPTIRQMPNVVTDQDRLHLQRALELAGGGRGQGQPQPVGGRGAGARRRADWRGIPRPARRSARRGGRPGRLPRSGPRSVGSDALCDLGALRPSRAPATVHRCHPRGRIGAGRDRLRGPERTGERARPRNPPRRGRRGPAGERPRGNRGKAPESGVSKAHPDDSPARPAEVGHQPRRSRGHRERRLEVDLRRAQPRAGSPLAGRVRRRLRRDRHRARRRSAADGQTGHGRPRSAPAHPGRVRLPGAPATGLPPGPLDRRGAAGRDRLPGRGARTGRGAPRRRGRADRLRRGSAGTRRRGPGRARTAPAHLPPAGGRARPWPDHSSTPARSTSCGCSSPRSCSAVPAPGRWPEARAPP